MLNQAPGKMLQRVPSMHEDKKSVSEEATRIYDQTEVKVSWSTSTQSDLDLDDHDILDLHRMAEKFESRIQTNNRITKDSKIDRLVKMHAADYEKIRTNDRILKQAYDLLSNPAFLKYPVLVRETKELITHVEKQPHLYTPYKREETTYQHVTRWLDNHTSNPQAELRGFTNRDSYEPKRFIPTVLPRVSNSDTNVLLGKRKRNSVTEEDDGLVLKSGSDTRLVCEQWCRPVKYRRRS